MVGLHCGGPAEASAQSAGGCGFFKGKTVELVIPFSAGGGFDVYGRMVAKYMGDELRGGAHDRAQPAGRRRSARDQPDLERDARRVADPARIGQRHDRRRIPGGAAGVAFNINGFSWIGRVSGEPDVIATGPDSTIKEPCGHQGDRRDRARCASAPPGIGSPQYVGSRLLANFVEANARGHHRLQQHARGLFLARARRPHSVHILAERRDVGGGGANRADALGVQHRTRPRIGLR